MAAGYSFRPRAWTFVAAALACGAGLALGHWQSGRAEEKRALGARLEEALREAPVELAESSRKEDVLGRRVAARGEFLGERTVFLDNKLRGGRVGYEVITPLRLADSERHVLVNRGWVVAGPRRDALPEVPTPPGSVRVEGVAQERLAHAMQAGPDTGRVRQNVELQAYAAETGLALMPFFIQQLAGPADGLARDWPRPDAGADKHEAYAFQWYSLAGLAVALAVVLSFKRVGQA